MKDKLPYVYRHPATVYIDGEMQPQLIDEGLINLHRGQGVIWADGRRLRVVDSWFSFDHHGRFDTGLHVFLEEVTDEADDLPKRLEPHYFRDGLRQTFHPELSSEIRVPGKAAGSDEGAPVYQRDGAAWSEAEVREFAAAAGKWDFGVEYLRYIAERAPSAVSVEVLAKDLEVDSRSIGGKLSGLGKWLKQHGKIRADKPEWTVWPIDVSYDAKGRAMYRMSETVAQIILNTLK